MSTAGRVVSDVIGVYILVLFVRILADNIFAFAPQARPSGVLIPILEFMYTVTDPPLKLLRRIVPPLRIGGAAIDLSPILLFIALYAIRATVVTRL
jgi:YggT family protein